MHMHSLQWNRLYSPRLYYINELLAIYLITCAFVFLLHLYLCILWFCICILCVFVNQLCRNEMPFVSLFPLFVFFVLPCFLAKVKLPLLYLWKQKMDTMKNTPESLSTELYLAKRRNIFPGNKNSFYSCISICILIFICICLTLSAWCISLFLKTVFVRVQKCTFQMGS